MEELEILLENGKKEHEEKGYRKFISDGIVNYRKWENQSTPKVCYFLKEAYDVGVCGKKLQYGLKLSIIHFLKISLIIPVKI